MSFSMAGCSGCIHERNSHLNSKNVTLQVRILLFCAKQQVWICHGKKAFLPAPEEKKALSGRGMAASLTLEAAIVLSLFIFAVVCMILPMKIMNTERKIQAALESTGEEFSRYAYLKDVLEKGEELSIPGASDFAKAFCGHLAAGAAQGYTQAAVMGHVDTTALRRVRMLRSSVLEDGETFDLILDYEIQMPFPVLGLDALQRTARCRRRAWIGRAGKAGGFGDGVGGQGDPDEIVYVGKDSTRYHRSRSCHYLANNLSAVAYEQVSGMRNDSGGKYYACGVCGAGVGSGGTVYLMPSGTSYHTTKNCRAIVAYARAVKLSEVEHLGGCSYCSR